MKKIFLFLLLFTNLIFSQTTIFSENIGTPTGTTPIATYVGGTTPATFQNISTLTYSNGGQTSADIRNTNPSGVYTGASGGGNVFFTTTSGAYGFSIESINASNYTSITLDYGYRKELGTVLSSFSVDYWNGSSWVTIANTSTSLFNETSTATIGWYSAKTLSLPAAAQINGLKIRFVKSGTNSIRIDDIVLKGVISGCSTTITTQPTNQTIVENNSTTFSVTATNVSSYQWQVSTDGTNYTNITNSGIYSGANSSILSISNTSLAMSGYKYRCQLTPNPTCTITLINQNFNTNDFSFVNSATPTNNNWRYGTAAGNPSSAIYISNDNGITNNYTLTSTPNITFAYRDVFIPSGTTTSNFSFDWRCNGERTVGTDYDYLRVWLTPTSFTPVEGTQIVAGSGRIQVGSNFNQQNTWTNFSNTSLNVSSFAGSSMRIIYEWTNDSSGGSQFPAAIDNVILTIPSTTLSNTIVNTNIVTLSVTGNNCLLEGFSGGTTAPASWTFTNIGTTYTSATNFGLTSPSLSMDATGDIIETPIISNIQQLSFWIKGQGTNTSSALLVEGFNGTSWITVDNITNSIPTTGTIKIYNSTTNPALPLNLQKFRFTYTKSVGNLALDDVSFNCSLCPSVTTWNGTSWSNNSPNSSTTAVIDSNYNTNTNSFEACSVIVNPGKTLTINSNQYISIQNSLINNGIVDINDGTLVQSNSVTNVGNINYNRSVNTLNGYDYIYWSSPVLGQSLSTLYNSPTPGFRYEWNPIISNTNGTFGNWVNLTTPNMLVGKGYIMRSSSSFGWTGNLLSIFTGVPNNGSITYTLSGINSPITNYRWNLVGNPYPSSIKALKFLTDNSNIDGFVNIWTHGTAPVSTTNPYYQSFQYNYTSNDYITYNGIGTSSGPTGFNGYIASGQGFFVNLLQANTPSSNIIFNNSMRSEIGIPAYSNSQFYRTSESNNEGRIWLDLLNTNNIPTRILVGYKEDATIERDRLYDAITSQNFYSMINNDKFIIQGRPDFNENDQVNLGINIPTAGEYKIAIVETDGILTTQNIYLQDLYSNMIYDIRQSPYIFNSNAGTFNDRFILRYTNNTLDNNDFVINNTIIYNKDNRINIDSNKIIKNVKVYDITGKLLYDNKFNSNNVKVTLECSKQILLVKIKTDDDEIITKKISN